MCAVLRINAPVHAGEKKKKKTSTHITCLKITVNTYVLENLCCYEIMNVYNNNNHNNNKTVDSIYVVG